MTLTLDRSTWTRVKFGEVARQVKTKVDPTSGVVDRYVAGEHMVTDELRITSWGSVGGGYLGPAFHARFRPGQVLYGSRRTYLRKVALADFDGVCANTTFVIEVKDPSVLLPDLLPFVMTTEAFHAHSVSESKGSVNPYVNWPDLAKYEFDLPPLSEQERIAELLWAVERHRDAHAGALSVMQKTLSTVVTHRLSGMPATARLGDLVTTRSGPSFAASDVHEGPVAGSVPVLGIPNTRPDGSIDLSEVGHVTGLPDSLGLVDESSLILIRTNGNRQRIGNTYLPPVQAHGHAVSAFQFLMKVSDPANREYLFWVLSESRMQARMSAGASGSVGLGNLAVRWLNRQSIPWSPDHADRRSVVVEFRQLSAAISSVELEASSLDHLRSALLADIFGGCS